MILMIQQHLGVWLWKGPRPDTTLYDYPAMLTLNALGGLSAPLFITLAGIGVSLMANRQPDRAIDSTLVRRGAAVLAMGVALNLAIPSWFGWQSWYVLHLMGFGFITSPALRRLSTTALLWMTGIVILGTGAVHSMFDVPSYLTNDYLAGRSDQTPETMATIRLALFEGQFPIFPWFGLFTAGVVIGRWTSSTNLRRILGLGSVVAGLVVAGVSANILGAGSTASIASRTFSLHLPFFPASPLISALLLGFVILGVWLALRFQNLKGFGPRSPLVVLGRASLSLLIVHVWLFRELIQPDGWWPTHLPPLAIVSNLMPWWKQLGTATTIAAIIGVLATITVLVRIWSRVGYKYGAEWTLRKLAP